MVPINFNHWFIQDNELSISLMSFYVKIIFIGEKNVLLFHVSVINGETEIKELTFDFSTLEEAISFTENIVSKCQSFDEVKEKYDRIYMDNKIYQKVR